MIMTIIEVETRKSLDVVDITDRVIEALRECEIDAGICLVYSLHTTTGLAINEADGPLIRDILNLLEKIAPEGAGYQHDRGDGNAHAHLRAMILGNSVMIPVEEGRLVMGIWQRILFFELDGPRERRILVRGISGQLTDR
jgi:secondary thiamine-phosphate synthase enzyme